MEVCGVEIDFNKQNGYFINADCMEGMKQFPDKYFDLAIVDPPYGDAKLSENPGGGIGTDSGRGSTGTSIHRQRKNVRQPDGTWGYPSWWGMGEEVHKKIITWDIAPGKEYFDELFRVSRNQIIWGGELLRVTTNTVLSCLAKADDQRKIQHGDG